MKKLLAIAVVLACPAWVSGAHAAGADETPPAATEAKNDPIVCRVNKRTGSRVKVNRVCMTQSKWDEMQNNIRSGINEMTRNSRGTGSGVNPLTGN